MTVNENKEIVSKNDYYPFGMQMPGMCYNEGNSNDRYKYSSKELETMGSLSKYHYGFREYDPEIGRWNWVDPLYFQTPGQSPYSFVSNNPVKHYDVAGLFTNDIQFIWHLEWTLNWSAEYQMGVTGDFSVDGGGVRVSGDGQGTVIVSGKNFSVSFNGIPEAMSREYKEEYIRALTEAYYQLSVQLIEQYIDFYDNLLTSQVIQIREDIDLLAQISFQSISDISKSSMEYWYKDPSNPNYWYERWKGTQWILKYWDCSMTSWFADIRSGVIDLFTSRYTTSQLVNETFPEFINKTPGVISTWQEGDYLVFQGDNYGHVGRWTNNYRNMRGMWHNSSKRGVHFTQYGSDEWLSLIQDHGWPYHIPLYRH